MGWNNINSIHSFDPRNPEDLAFNGYIDCNFIGSSLLHKGMEDEFTDHFRNPSESLQDLYEENMKVRLQMMCKNTGKIFCLFFFLFCIIFAVILIKNFSFFSSYSINDRYEQEEIADHASYFTSSS